MAAKHLNIPFQRVRRTCHPNMRLGVYQIVRPCIRGFHATSRLQFVDECLVQTHTVINGLHTITGLPWAASIPLTAILIRALVIFPIDYYSRMNNAKRRLIAQEVQRVAEQKGAKAYAGKNAREKSSMIDAYSRRTFIGTLKERRLQNWKGYLLFIRLPIWLMVMETLRRMAGVKEGMLGLVWKSLTGNHNIGEETSELAVIPVEESLVAEGMLWFPNLLLPDPVLLLPFLLSATLLFANRKFAFRSLNTFSGQLSDPGVVIAGSKKMYDLRMSRLQKAFALAVIPATLQFPSVMILYWISSGLSSFGSKYLLCRWIPSIDPAPPTMSKHTSGKQQFRGPTMQGLRSQIKNKTKRKPKP